MYRAGLAGCSGRKVIVTTVDDVIEGVLLDVNGAGVSVRTEAGPTFLHWADVTDAGVDE